MSWSVDMGKYPGRGYNLRLHLGHITSGFWRNAEWLFIKTLEFIWIIKMNQIQNLLLFEGHSATGAPRVFPIKDEQLCP